MASEDPPFAGWMHGVGVLPRRGTVTVADVPRMSALYSPDNAVPAATVAKYSNKRFRWRCPKGEDHIWEAPAASIANSSASGCPYCAGKRPSVTNRLDLLHPDLAAEWDPIANNGPATIVAGSERKAWWRCSQGHTWQANIRNRTVLGAGCPRCAHAAGSVRRSAPSPGGSLADLHPEVAAQWHPTLNTEITPVEVKPLSNRPRWWLCEAGHEWQVSPAGRISKGGAGCPYCSGRFATTESSLLAQRPDLAAQWHPELNGPLTPEAVKPGSSKLVWWRCPEGHDYRSLISNRASLNRGCPYCTGQRVGYGNDLQAVFPEVAGEWAYDLNGALKPDAVTAGTHRRAWWRCPRGHTWQASIASRAGGGVGCPECAAGWRRSWPEVVLQHQLSHALGIQVLGDYPVNTDDRTYRVDVVCPELRAIVEYDGSFWHAESLRSDTERTQELLASGWLVVRVREEPLQRITDLDVVVQPDRRDLFAMTADLLCALARGAQEVPDDHPATRRSNWLASIERNYRAGGALLQPQTLKRLSRERRRLGTEDPSPPPPRPLKGASLAERSPAIAAEWHPTRNAPLIAADVANARNASAWWICSKCGKAWEATVNARVRHQRVHCPECNRKEGARRRAAPPAGGSLADLHPEIAAEWDCDRNGTLGPDQVRPGSHQHVWWKCALGHSWQIAIYNRTAKGSGCRDCRKVGR